MNRQSITSNEVGKGADAQVNSICGVFCLWDNLPTLNDQL